MRLTRSRQACVASRAETSRLASRAVSSVRVSRLSMSGAKKSRRGRQSLDDFRNNEQPAGLGRGIAKRLLVRKRSANFVGAGHVHHRHGVGRRFDSADVDLAQLLDVAEHLAELRAEFALFLRCEAKSGEVGHIFHVDFRCRHGAKSTSAPGKFNAQLRSTLGGTHASADVTGLKQAHRKVLWTAPAEPSDDGALAAGQIRAPEPNRCRAALATALPK